MVALNKTYRETLTPDRSAKDSGLRFYSAEISRWLNRDPIGEMGGIRLYGYLRNRPVHLHDYLGLAPASGIAYKLWETMGSAGMQLGLGKQCKGWHTYMQTELLEIDDLMGALASTSGEVIEKTLTKTVPVLGVLFTVKDVVKALASGDSKEAAVKTLVALLKEVDVAKEFNAADSDTAALAGYGKDKLAEWAGKKTIDLLDETSPFGNVVWSKGINEWWPFSKPEDPYALCHINWTYHIIKGGEYTAWCHYHSKKNCCEVNVKAQGTFKLDEDVTGSAISVDVIGGEWSPTKVKIW